MLGWFVPCVRRGTRPHLLPHMFRCKVYAGAEPVRVLRQPRAQQPCTREMWGESDELPTNCTML